jgi:hypothetical protein
MKKSIKKDLFRFLDSIESPKIFHGWWLQKRMFSITGKQTYPSTLLDYAREYADITGSDFVCLNKALSKYKFERIHKISKAILN